MYSQSVRLPRWKPSAQLLEFHRGILSLSIATPHYTTYGAAGNSVSFHQVFCMHVGQTFCMNSFLGLGLWQPGPLSWGGGIHDFYPLSTETTRSIMISTAREHLLYDVDGRW